MKQFVLSGIIGWDVTGAELRRFLLEAGGDDVEVVVSSPGGLVADALEMFNGLRRYPGRVTATLAGFAMSAASYVPLAADFIRAEDNAVYMIHNVHGGVFGDHNYILKYGRETEALSGLLARAYATHTGRDLDEIREMMDEETFFYGPEIVDAGFADELVETGDGSSDGAGATAAKAAARVAFQECGRRLAADSRAAADDLVKAAALAAMYNGNNRAAAPATGKGGPQSAPGREEQDMDLKTLKEKHPDLVAAVADETMAGLDEEKLKTARPDLVSALARRGAEAETERIRDVRAQLIPGHEDLIARLELDGKSTGADAAKAIVAAEKQLRERAAEAMEDNANDPVPPANPDDGNRKEMLRKDYDALSISEQRAFIAGGGTVKD